MNDKIATPIVVVLWFYYLEIIENKYNVISGDIIRLIF